MQAASPCRAASIGALGTNEKQIHEVRPVSQLASTACIRLRPSGLGNDALPHSRSGRKRASGSGSHQSVEQCAVLNHGVAHLFRRSLVAAGAGGDGVGQTIRPYQGGVMD